MFVEKSKKIVEYRIARNTIGLVHSRYNLVEGPALHLEKVKMTYTSSEYDKLLKKIRMSSLANRRKQDDCITAYKALNN